MSVFTVLATSKVAAGVLAAGTLAVGGTGAAAVSGVLPTQAQQTAHELFGAPAPKLAAEAAGDAQATPAPTATAAVSDALKSADATAEATGKATATAEASDDKASADVTGSATANTAVDAAGPAALGLCTAFTHGGLDASSQAFSSLSIAAKGDANIKSYCTDVVAKADAAAKAGAEGKGSASVEATK
ncbi:MAG TPA: protein tyrosine phosphatase, partial [Arthrobacter sp.]|nr:protein tyrosine phosphatase [Arthrobacter sp.]